MNPYERVFRRLAGKPVDRAPNLSIVMGFAARHSGIPYRKYATDYRHLVEANLKCCQDFQIDMVSTISDPCREGHDLGAEIRLPEDAAPSFSRIFLEDYGDLAKLKVRDPLKGERMLDRIKAVELFQEKAGESYPVLGWIEGAFASASNLRGVNNLMLDLIERPAEVHNLLEICAEQAILFAREQVRAGADFIGMGDATASLISPGHYREFVLPYEKRICRAIQEEGARVKLHICGNITALLPEIARTGVDMVDIDWMVDFAGAVEELKGKAAVCGNFDPVDILLQGSRAEVREAVERCLAAGEKDTFIAPGCEVPGETPRENMREIARALEELS